VYRDSGVLGYLQHYLGVGDLPIIVCHSFASLMLFVYYVPYSRIGVCLFYIWSCVWGSIENSGTRCVDYYLIPWRVTSLIRRKILDSAVNEVSEALSIHVAPPAIRIVVVPTGVTILLGLCIPPCSWTGMVGPSLPGFTIAPCVFLAMLSVDQAAYVYPSRQSQNLKYVYAFIQLHFCCPTRL
jgi:hypothetical protein